MASISCQHIYKIYPGATAPSVTDFNLEIQDKEFIIVILRKIFDVSRP